MLNDELAVDSLERFEVPALDDCLAYWAAQPTVEGGMAVALALPHASYYGAVAPSGSAEVWVDPEDGWLWVSVPTDERAWLTAEQAREGWGGPKRGDAVPAWVREAGANWRNHRQMTGLLVRRPVDAEEAARLLDEIMPAAEQYALPEPLAGIMRAGGWPPEKVASLWWTVDTEEDAAALAARVPSRWERDKWPLASWSFPGTVAQATAPLPARVIPRLVDAGVPGDLLEHCIGHGIRDVDYITSVRHPRIPDDATRIILSGGNNLYTDPSKAREALAAHPGLWAGEVTCDSGPVPLHVASRWGGDPEHMVVWSDGRLDEGYVVPPADVPSGEATRTWHLRYRAFEAAQGLLALVVSARNRADLTPELWMPWKDATGTDSAEVEQRTTERALATDITAKRVLTLTRHTVHQADGTPGLVWEVQSLLTHSGTYNSAFNWSRQRWVYAGEADARARLEELDDGLPPLVTVREAAGLLGATRDALAQAMSRGREQRAADLAKPRARRDRRAYPPHSVTTTGRTDWYDPRPVTEWWQARPGHGPGRGRTA